MAGLWVAENTELWFDEGPKVKLPAGAITGVLAWLAPVIRAEIIMALRFTKSPDLIMTYLIKIAHR